MGVRMGGGIPKQFLPIKGKPVLFHTIEKFHGLVDEILLVLPQSHIPFWKELCIEHSFNLNHSLIEGGNSRTESVLNGLSAISSPGIVAIHDAVRPLISRNLIQNLINHATVHGNAIPYIPARESMRVKSSDDSKVVNRDDFMIIQTPQCFDYQLIMKSYQNAADRPFSDDASVLDHAGVKIHLIEGETTNIKITYREDILFAEAILDATEM